MNAGLFPKPLHVLFACIAGMKQSVQAASLEVHVMIHIMQLKKEIYLREARMGNYQGVRVIMHQNCTQ